MSPCNDSAIRNAILDLLAQRSAGASICPSEAARRVFPDDWRPLMPRIREVAIAMQQEGILEICQRGEVIDPASARGPVRLRLESQPTDAPA